MISSRKVLRSRLVPVAILVAIVALLGLFLTWGGQDGSDLQTIGGTPTSVLASAPAQGSRNPLPARAVNRFEGGGDGGATSTPALAASTTPGPPTTSPTTPAAGAGDPTAGVGTGTETVPASPATSPTTAATATVTTAAATTGSPSTTARPATTARPTTTAPPSTSPTTARPAPKPPAGCGDPWANLEGCGWAGPGNTGPRAANCPNGFTNAGTGVTGQIRITTPGTVISCQRISGNVVIQATGVVVRDSYISFDGGGGNGGGAIVVSDGGSATIEHVEVDGRNHTHSCVWHQGISVTVNAMHCRGVVDGMFAFARLAYSPTAGDNFTLTNSYFHSFTANASNGHMDGFQTEGTSNGVISGNTFLMNADSNAAIAIWNSVKSANNIQITGNLIAGSEWVVYVNDYHPSQGSPSGGNAVTNVSFTNNVFSTRFHACVGLWGIWYTTNNVYGGGPTDGWRRSGNTVAETGANVDNGNPACR